MKMNQFFLFITLCFSAAVHGQSGYKTAIGGRVNTYISYDVLAASYKSFLSEHGALEFNLGFGGRNMYIPNSGGKSGYSPGVSLSGSYQYHVPIETPSGENLCWFAGGGLTVFNIFSKNSFYDGFGAGLFATGGIDYKFKNAPVNLTADWRPTVFIDAPSSFAPLQLGTFGVAARYTIK